MKFSDTKRSSMELQILRLIDYLQNKEDNRAGFMVKIDAALSHARYLEERCYNLHFQNEELRDKCQIPMPVLNFKMETVPEPVHNYKSFQWEMEALRYRDRIPVPNLAQFRAENEEFWRLVRRQSYRSFLKLFRKKFDENFERFLQNYK